jgi:hypothetical protein
VGDIIDQLEKLHAAVDALLYTANEYADNGRIEIAIEDVTALNALVVAIDRRLPKPVKTPVEVPRVRQDAPDCQTCGRRTRITSTRPKFRYWRCNKCKLSGKVARN